MQPSSASSLARLGAPVQSSTPTTIADTKKEDKQQQKCKVRLASVTIEPSAQENRSHKKVVVLMFTNEPKYYVSPEEIRTRGYAAYENMRKIGDNSIAASNEFLSTAEYEQLTKSRTLYPGFTRGADNRHEFNSATLTCEQIIAELHKVFDSPALDAAFEKYCKVATPVPAKTDEPAKDNSATSPTGALNPTEPVTQSLARYVV